MTDLPYQCWFEADFANDTKAMSFEDRCAYRAVLQVMWANHGWLPGDDQICARMMGCDTRKWRSIRARLQPRLRGEVDPVLGPILRQKRIARDWTFAVEQIAKNKARTAPATAERRRKAAERRNVTVEHEDDRYADREPDRSDAVPALAQSPEPYKKGRASEPSASAAPPVPANLPSLSSASGEIVASGKPPEPSDPALVKRLVSDGLKRPRATGLMAALEPREDDT